MRKFLLSACILLGLSLSLNAQKQVQSSLKKGDILVNGNVAFGIGGFFYGTSADYVLLDHLGGATASLTTGAYAIYNSFIGFSTGAEADYHYQFLNDLDTYAGLQLGYRFGATTQLGSSKSRKLDPSVSKALNKLSEGLNMKTKGGFAYNIHVGARYFFIPQLAATVELGFGNIGLVRARLSYKF